MPTFREHLAIAGNLNRIEEMKSAGIGSNTISGMFRDHGMDVSPEQIDALSSALPELGKKALPKKEVKKVMSAAKDFNKTSDLVTA
ncbi:TPA: hypothetical protein ACFNMZ_002021 [Neisseria polysaccharea]